MIIPKEVRNMMVKLESAGYKAYIVGGAVRDHLIGIEPHDYDIFTNATGDQLKKIFPKSKVLGDEERQAKILIVINDGVEISSFRKSGDRTETGTTLEEHQSTCDFTINSMAVDKDGELNGINSANAQGMKDLRRRRVRFVGDEKKRIEEDKLRILRGYRFICKYGFNNWSTMNTKLHLLHDLPKERVSEELKKIFGIKRPWNNTARELWNIFEELLPEIKDNVGVEGGNFHSETVDKHMKNAVEVSFKITDDPIIRMAAFLHDIGKGVTKTIDAEIIKSINDKLMTAEEFAVHFYEHEKIGAEIVEKWMREYKFSECEIKKVTTLIKLHMYSYKDEPSKKSYIKFFAKLESIGLDIMDYITLIYCDHQGNEAKPRIKFGDFVKDSWLLRKYWECKYTNEPFTVHELVVGGKDLIERYGFEPGPLMGKLLNTIHERIMDGDLTNNRAEIFHRLETMQGALKKVN